MLLTLVLSLLTCVSCSAYYSGKVRLGECMLWVVETIRLGHYASFGCKMVRANAENYEGIYFLTDEELLDAAARYRRWWENRQYPRTAWTIDACFDEPLDAVFRDGSDPSCPMDRERFGESAAHPEWQRGY